MLKESWEKFLWEQNMRTIFEGRLQDLISKYPEVEEQINHLSRNDPSGKNKYLQWMLSQNIKGHSPEDILKAVNSFHKNQQRFSKRDIFQYKDLEALEAAVNSLTATKKQKKAKAQRQVVTLFEDDKVSLASPVTIEASQKLGLGTGLCISWISAQEKNRFLPYFYYKKAIFVFVFKKEDGHQNLLYVLTVGPTGTSEITSDQNNALTPKEAISLSGRKYYQMAKLLGRENYERIFNMVVENFNKNPNKLDLIDDYPFMIKYTDPQTEELQLAAVESFDFKPEFMALIKDPSEDVQLAAAQIRPEVIEYIQNPAPQVREYLAESAYFFWDVTRKWNK